MLVRNLISTYTSEYTTRGITIQEKKTAQRPPWRYQVVLVKRTSDHCKTVEFPMKACWKEDAQVVASESQEETATYDELKIKY